MILKFSNLDSLQQLAEQIGVSKQNLYDINKGKCGISKNMRERILTSYPRISRAWLEDSSEVMVSDSPTITTHASGNADGSVKFDLRGLGGNSSEKDIEITALRKEVELLKQIIADKDKQIEFLKELLKK